MSNYNNPMNKNMNTDQNILKNATKITDIKPDGEQNNKRNLIIVAVIIVLIVFGIYFKGRQANNEDVVNDTNTELPVGESDLSVDNEAKDINIVDDKALDVASGTPMIIDKNKDSYNLALKNGTDAFLAGNYTSALAYYDEALKYKNSDVVYIRMFTVYSMQGDTVKARASIDKAIELNPSYTEYWNTKIQYLDEKTTMSYTELKAIYTAGLAQVDSRTKINLVTSFARTAESAGEVMEAINIWKYAQQVYPQNSTIYQAEIDRLTLTIQ